MTEQKTRRFAVLLIVASVALGTAWGAGIASAAVGDPTTEWQWEPDCDDCPYDNEWVAAVHRPGLGALTLPANKPAGSGSTWVGIYDATGYPTTFAFMEEPGVWDSDDCTGCVDAAGVVDPAAVLLAYPDALGYSVEAGFSLDHAGGVPSHAAGFGFPAGGGWIPGHAVEPQDPALWSNPFAESSEWVVAGGFQDLTDTLREIAPYALLAAALLLAIVFGWRFVTRVIMQPGDYTNPF